MKKESQEVEEWKDTRRKGVPKKDTKERESGMRNPKECKYKYNVQGIRNLES